MTENLVLTDIPENIIITDLAIRRFQQRILEDIDYNTAKAYISIALEKMREPDGPKPVKQKNGAITLDCEVDGVKFILLFIFEPEGNRVTSVILRKMHRFEFVRELEIQNIRLKGETKQLKQDLSGARNDIKGLENKVRNYELQIASQERRLTERQANADKLMGIIRSYKDKHTQALESLHELQLYLEGTEEPDKVTISTHLDNIMESLKPGHLRRKATKEKALNESQEDR